MGIKKNEHLTTWAIGTNGHFGANRYLGPMGIGGMWKLRQMDRNEHYGANGHFGTDGHWGK